MPTRSLLICAALCLVLGVPALAASGNDGLDRSFAGHGFVEAPGWAEWIGGAPAPGPRVALYPGGRLLVGGSSRSGFVAYRYLANGRPDPSFDQNGIAVATLPGGEGEGAFGSVSAVAVQPDGRILLAGLYTPYPVDNCEECEPEYGDPREYSAIVRLDPDGGLDTRFGGSRHGHRHEGMVPLRFRSVNDMVVHGGEIYIAGEEVTGDETEESGYVARFHLDGRPDRSFGQRGYVSLPRSAWRKGYQSSSVAAIAFDHRGRIYAGGFDRGRFMLARLDRHGELDRGFGRRGFARSRVGAHCRCAYGLGLARDRQGRLVLSGFAGKNNPSFALARFLPGGRLDRSFGDGGFVRTGVPGHPSYGDGVAVDSRGRIVVAGATERPHLYQGKLTVLRYRPNGDLDRSFFGDGRFEGRFVKGGDRGQQALFDGAGRLIVAGEAVVVRFRRGG